MIRSVGMNDGTDSRGGVHWLTKNRRLREHPPHRSRGQVEPGPAEHLGDLDLTQAGAQQLQALDDVPDEVGELVDGLP